MFDSIFLLAGDSDSRWNLPDPLWRTLAPLFGECVSQQEILQRTGQASFDRDLDKRLALLDALVPRGDAARRVVLAGRSSGARVASLFASRREVAAVICVSYPFRMPNRRLEHERFAHLEHITVPTLILQGCDDEYGGIDLTEHYPLSPSVSLRFLCGDHALTLSPGNLARAAQLMRSFCQAVADGRPFESARFDEAFYLRTHSRAAAEVAAGRFASAEQYHREVGRDARLIYRLLPEDGASGP